jgi:CrcB protein
VADEHTLVSPGLRLFLVTGLLGGFTTFSAFGMETWQLVEDGRGLAALANAAGSLAAGLAAVAAGVAITRQLV